MISLSNETILNQKDDVCSTHYAHCYIYKQWVGRIVTYGTGTIAIKGNATEFLSVGDKVIVSCKSLNTEYTIDTRSYNSSTCNTTITFIESSTVFTANVAGKDYIYKKFIVTRYLNKDIGDIRKSFENGDFGSIRPYQINLSFISDKDEFDLIGTPSNPELFFKDMLVTTVIAVAANGSNTRITVSSDDLSAYNSNLLLEYYVNIINGDGRNLRSKIIGITAASGYIDVEGDWTTILKAADTICISMQNRFMIKLLFEMKGSIDSRINVFFGIIYPKNVTLANRRIDVIAYSLIKDLDVDYSFQVSDKFVNGIQNFPNIPGITIYSYDQGDRVSTNEEVVGVQYKFPSSDLRGVTGVEIIRASSDTGLGARILRYKRPNTFQWDGGDWVEVATDSTEINLAASDGSTITCNFRVADYQQSDAEDLIFMTAENKYDIVPGNRGPAGIKVGDGGIVQLFSRLFRIWVDDNYVAGTVYPLTDVLANALPPYEIVPVTTNEVAIYFGLIQKFGAMEFRGLTVPGNSISSENLTWEYSLASGTDPSCFRALTVVDGTNGFSQDGVISWNIPDNHGMKAKIGASTEFHMYYIRLRIAAGAANFSKVYYEIVPYTTAFGSKNDVFTFKHDWHRLSSKNELSDDIIIKLDTDGATLVPAIWKQCVRVIDVLDQLIDKSGYGVDITRATGLIELSQPTLNVWGKPGFSEERKPTAVCVGSGTCTGYVFACFKNEIICLASIDDEWKKIGEVDFCYTLHSIQYFEVTEDAALRHFILAIGYRDTIPPASIDEASYYEQPEQIMVRIDGVDDLDTSSLSFVITANGGNTISGTYFSAGNGLYDTLHLIRSGAHDYVLNWNGSDVYIHTVGNVKDDAGLSLWWHCTENIYIPFRQLLLIINRYAINGTKDLQFDVAHLYYRTLEEDDVLDTLIPAFVNPGYYNILNDTNTPQSEMALRYSIGQRGGYNKVQFPVGTGTEEYGIYGYIPYDIGGTWLDAVRVGVCQAIFHGDTAITESVGNSGSGMRPQGSWGSQDIGFAARTLLLDALQLTPNVNESDYIIQSVYDDWYQNYVFADKRIIPCNKSIELTTLRETVGSSFLPTDSEIWFWDNSASTWTSVNKNWSVPVTLDQNDILLFADKRRFARLFIDYEILSTTIDLTDSDFSVGDLFGDGYEFSSSITEGLYEEWYPEYLNDVLTGGGVGSGTTILDYPMMKFWLRNNYNPGGGPNITGKYIFRLKQTGTGSLRINLAKFTRRQLWSNMGIDVENSYGWTFHAESGTYGLNYDYVPLELCWDQGDYIYGCLLDQVNRDYSIFAHGIVSQYTTGDLPELTAMSIEQITDPEMQLVGFVYNPDDGYVYFVATDRKYQRKTAQLWKAKYSGTAWTITKLTDIVAGEWDCPVKLIYVDGKICGFTGPHKNYFWEWSDSFYLRLPVANFGNKKIREIADKMCEIMNLTMVIDEQAKTITRKRMEDDPETNINWDKKVIVNIEFIRESDAQVDGVSVNWQLGEYSGVETVGENTLSSEILTINNEYVFFPQVARIIAEQLWRFFVQKRREIEGTIIFMYQHQLFDVATINLADVPMRTLYNVESTTQWLLKNMTVSFKRKNIRFVVLENKG